jgi:hypothetical protein
MWLCEAVASADPVRRTSGAESGSKLNTPQDAGGQVGDGGPALSFSISSQQGYGEFEGLRIVVRVSVGGSQRDEKPAGGISHIKN